MPTDESDPLLYRRAAASRPADTIDHMSRIVRIVAASLILAAASAGCQRHGTPTDRKGAEGPASLPRAGITVARRAEWRVHLKWSDDCEDAFRASHAGDDGGISVVRLGAGVSLVEVTCAAGSYQPSVIRFRLIEDATGAHTMPLSFPVYSSDDGRDLRLSHETEVWGDSVVTAATAEIAILSLARQTADCGVWARYSLVAGQPRLLGAAARVRCPGAPGPPATVSGSGPPAEWDTIPRKD